MKEGNILLLYQPANIKEFWIFVPFSPTRQLFPYGNYLPFNVDIMLYAFT